MEKKSQNKSKKNPGRGAVKNIPNRFNPIEYIPAGDKADNGDISPQTEFYRDTSQSVITYNDSPDVGFNAGINLYRGCEHGCIYCYARPTHEYFDLSPGLDFETKIFVKEDAPQLLRRELASPKWKPQVVGISGVTDPYQPVECRLQLTRRCLEVFLEFRNPVVIITKNHLVTRDIDVLRELASHQAARVTVSITTLDAHLARVMEPRTSQPARRLEAIRKLSEAGISVGTLVAPVIPGLTDHEMPEIIRSAVDAGAEFANYITLRLPYGVSNLFEDWLERNFQDRKDKVLNRIKAIRGGKLNSPKFHERMRGEGIFAEQIDHLFKAACRKAGLDGKRTHLSVDAFRRPNEQLKLF